MKRLSETPSPEFSAVVLVFLPVLNVKLQQFLDFFPATQDSGFRDKAIK